MKKVLLFFLMQSHTKPEKHTYFQVSKQKRKHALSLRVILENLFLKLSSKVLSTRNTGPETAFLFVFGQESMENEDTELPS